MIQIFLLLGRECAKSEKGHVWKKASKCVAIDGRIGGRHRRNFYITGTLFTVSWLVESVERK